MWNKLYKISGVAAFVTVVLIPLSIVAFIVWPAFPDDILNIIQDNWFAGLMSLDFMYLLSSVVSIPVFLILYVTLREVDESLSLLALVLGLLGLVLLVPARPIVEMFALSRQYAAAAGEAQRTAILVAKDFLLAQFEGSAYHGHYILGSASLLISAILMLRSSFYNKATAYVGIVTNIVVFGLYVPEIGAYISLLSVLGYFIWWIMLGLRFFRAGRQGLSS